jgi:hypothetical protein
VILSRSLLAIMEKITDKIAALPPDANYFSLEFFPPKTQMVGPFRYSPHMVMKLIMIWTFRDR